jgi:hypothetical protein
MSIHHAAIWLDRTRARVLHFEDQCFPARRLKKTIERRAPDAGVADVDGEFLRNVCEALADIPQLLLTGTSDAIAVFEPHAESKAPLIARRIMGVRRLGKPTNNGPAVFAWRHFRRPAGRRTAAK